MQPSSPPKFPPSLPAYECPRCGDTYDCATDDDRFEITLHRLLHIAGEWRRSLWPARYWAPASGRPAAKTTAPP